MCGLLSIIRLGREHSITCACWTVSVCARLKGTVSYERKYTIALLFSAGRKRSLRRRRRFCNANTQFNVFAMFSCTFVADYITFSRKSSAHILGLLFSAGRNRCLGVRSTFCNALCPVPFHSIFSWKFVPFHSIFSWTFMPFHSIFSWTFVLPRIGRKTPDRATVWLFAM